MKWRPALIAIGISVALALLPFIALRVLYGPYSVAPQFMDDSVYYYARMQAVAHGHPFIGNPYFLEHANELASAFFGADWFAAVPLLLGMPLLIAVLVNAAVWIGIFCALCIYLFNELGFSRRAGAISAVLCVLGCFWYLERPVAMQVVYPSFVFLLATYLGWLQNPSSRIRQLLLTLSAALSFYIYTYEWQITVILFGLTHLLLLAKEKAKYFSLLLIDAGVFLLAAPMLLYTKQQLTYPWYWETVRRIGLINTHTFGSAAVIVLVQLVLAASAIWFVRKRVPQSVRIFFLISGTSILVAAFSNVVTGKDLETAVHIGRFAALWALMAGLTSAVFFKNDTRKAYSSLSYMAAGISIVWVLALSFVQIRLISPQAVEGEKFASVLSWLRQNTAANSVILADDKLSYYIPAETNDYVLFQPDGGLYLMPDSEVAERYNISRAYGTTTVESLKNDYRLYAGVGNAVHTYKIHNRHIAICTVLRTRSCGVPVNSGAELHDPAYFATLAQQSRMIDANLQTFLARYKVAYIIQPDTESLPQRAWLTLDQVGHIDNYRIYKVR